jgi:hypothetical protein
MATSEADVFVGTDLCDVPHAFDLNELMQAAHESDPVVVESVQEARVSGCKTVSRDEARDFLFDYAGALPAQRSTNVHFFNVDPATCDVLRDAVAKWANFVSIKKSIVVSVCDATTINDEEYVSVIINTAMDVDRLLLWQQAVKVSGGSLASVVFDFDRQNVLMRVSDLVNFEEVMENAKTASQPSDEKGPQIVELKAESEALEEAPESEDEKKQWSVPDAAESASKGVKRRATGDVDMEIHQQINDYCHMSGRGIQTLYKKLLGRIMIVCQEVMAGLETADNVRVKPVITEQEGMCDTFMTGVYYTTLLRCGFDTLATLRNALFERFLYISVRCHPSGSYIGIMTSQV